MPDPAVPCPAEQTSGFLVVRTPSKWWTECQRHAEVLKFGEPYWSYIDQLREAVPIVRPECYGGVDRTPIERWLDGLDGLVGKNAFDERNMAAQRLVRKELGPDPTNTWDVRFFDPHLLPSLAFARAVIAAADDPTEWEVISIARCVEAKEAATLGFDVGYWGVGQYSIIRDTVVAPEHHAPDHEDFAELRLQTAHLNGNVLFDTAGEARAFREWYRSKTWAEQEGHPDEFQVIRVDAVPPLPESGE